MKPCIQTLSYTIMPEPGYFTSESISDVKGRLQWKITYAYYCLDMFI